MTAGTGGSRRLKVALVSSIGGHLTELLRLSGAFADHECFWIVNDVSPVLPVDAKAYRIAHAERDWKVLLNLFECAAIFSMEQPDVMVSAGAGPAVPAAVIARMAGMPVIYLEPISAVTAPTLTARLMQWLATRLYVQWPALRTQLRRAIVVSGVDRNAT
jgi:beta-1,4-N-acetylglucosaminyltransferase